MLYMQPGNSMMGFSAIMVKQLRTARKLHEASEATSLVSNPFFSNVLMKYVVQHLVTAP
jgi:hypothetical protein